MRFPYHLKPNRISDLKANHISNFKANHIPDRHIKLKSNCIQISKSKSPCMAEGFVESFSSKKTQSLECQDHFPQRQSSSWDKHTPKSLHYLLFKNDPWVCQGDKWQAQDAKCFSQVQRLSLLLNSHSSTLIFYN